MAQAAAGRARGLLQRASQTIKPMYEQTEKTIGTRFNAALEQNKQYIVKDQAQADKLFKQWFYTNMARVPDTINKSKQEWGQLGDKWSKRSEMPLPEVGTYLLFVGEVYAWYCVGEIVGRGFSVAGYKV